MRCGLTFCILFMVTTSQAKNFVTTEEALKLAFPNCEIKKEISYLTANQLSEAKKLSEGEIDSSLVLRYEGLCPNEKSGFAYVDVHRVRTQPESLFIVLNKDKSVRKIEMLSFNEPTEYIPKSKWYEQFQTQKLNDDLQIKKGITPVTGASLTARATTQAVRRVLALDQILQSAKP